MMPPPTTPIPMLRPLALLVRSLTGSILAGVARRGRLAALNARYGVGMDAQRSECLRLVWDEAFTRYDFGPQHPMTPIRLELTTRLIRDVGLLEDAGVRVVGAEPAPDEVLRGVHTEEYLQAVHEASE